MANTFESIINKAKKDWECAELMDAALLSRSEKLPFSSPLLNHSTYGGIPRNAITEFLGAPGGGKSSTAVDICKQAYNIFQQEFDDEVSKLRSSLASGNKTASVDIEELEERGPKKVLYVDLEHTFDAAWAKTLGIVPNTINIMQPPNVVAEEILQTVQELVETGEVGLIVLDSIPSLVPKQELEKKLGERTVAALAGLMTVFLRKMVPILKRYEATMLLINQTRPNMDNPYVVNSPGGEAIKFYSSLRILFKIGTPIDFLGNELPGNAENPAGYIITAKLLKQKSAPFDRKNGQYYLLSRSGIRIDMDFCQLAVKKYGFIKKGGAWFTMCDPYTGEILEDETGKPVKVNGFAKVLEYVQAHNDYFELMKKYITDDIEGNLSDEDEESDADGEI